MQGSDHAARSAAHPSRSRNGLVSLFLVALFALPVPDLRGQADGDTSGGAAPAVETRLKEAVGFLASDSLSGREAGTEGEEKACEYLCRRFAEIGLKCRPEGGTFVQTFEIPGTDGGPFLKARNVIGFVDRKSESTAVICAHYDHIGMGGKASRNPGRSEVHNGADDNASGVAALLEIADYAVHSEGLKDNYVFAAFSGHEKGLLGSAEFVRSNVCDLSKVDYVVNLDMVGRLDVATKRLVVGGVAAAVLDRILGGAGRQGLEVVCREAPKGDHSAFADQNVPFLFLTTGMHEDYHKVSDDADKINYGGLATVVRFVDGLVQALDGRGGWASGASLGGDGHAAETRPSDRERNGQPGGPAAPDTGSAPR